MKKTLLSIFCAILIAGSCLPLFACKKAAFSGEYKIRQLSFMGLTATSKSFKSYSENRSESDISYNSLYKPVYLLMNTKIDILGNGNAKIIINDFVAMLGGDSRYTEALKKATDMNLLQGGNLVVENVRYVRDSLQKDAYYIYMVNDNNEQISISEAWGTSLFAEPHIHAKIKNGQLAFKTKICIFEKEGENAAVALTTFVTVNMAH